MLVKVAPLGERVIEVNVEEGATVGQILETAGVLLNGRSIHVNNVAATEDTPVTNGDPQHVNIITLANKMKGGR